MASLDPRYLDYLACPVDGSMLHFDGRCIVSAAGRHYPVADGIPVMLRDDVDQTIGLAWTSLEAAWKATLGNEGDGFFVETLGISEDEKIALRQKLCDGVGAIDPVVSMLVGATNGIAYRSIIGCLREYPIPELRLPESTGGAHLLDIGCSWGRWSIAAARKGYQVVGIDPSLGAVLAARRVARAMELDNLYVVGDARYLPLRDSVFDQVFSYSVLQHMAKGDVERVLNDVARVLKPQGSSLVQMAAWSGVRSFMHLTRRCFREPRGFEVRYWGVGEISRAFARQIGPSSISVDCYFGLGLQYCDRSLMSPLPRTMTLLSERLRRLSERIPPLRFCADSLYISSRKEV
jgi:SAM-dependent methyltransferase/uncharacterized protein YbaR (Trm112 family)